MTADDQLVEVGGLLGGEPVEAQVVQDQQIREEEGFIAIDRGGSIPAG